jgi:hypothetical protein
MADGSKPSSLAKGGRELREIRCASDRVAANPDLSHGWQSSQIDVISNIRPKDAQDY